MPEQLLLFDQEQPALAQDRQAVDLADLRTDLVKSGDGTLRLIVFRGAVTCAALTLGGGAWLAGLL
ncbi:hypothetical protein [Streptomyces dangxiongensis]|nr:hypothetical protein [Streptomyces dangxiongensis]